MIPFPHMFDLKIFNFQIKHMRKRDHSSTCLVAMAVLSQASALPYNTNDVGITIYPSGGFCNVDGILIGDIFGLILALPIALFLAYWLSAVKSHWAVVIGALVFAIIGFVLLYGWASSLGTNGAPGANGGSVFF